MKKNRNVNLQFIVKIAIIDIFQGYKVQFRLIDLLHFALTFIQIQLFDEDFSFVSFIGSRLKICE